MTEHRMIRPEKAHQAGIMKLLVREIRETNRLINLPLVNHV